MNSWRSCFGDNKALFNSKVHPANQKENSVKIVLTPPNLIGDTRDISDSGETPALNYLTSSPLVPPETLEQRSAHALKDIAAKGKLNIFVGTWNMYGRPPPETLDPFVPMSMGDSNNDYHIVAIGTQECERSIEKSVLYPSKEVWESYLCEYLQARYSVIKSETMAAIHLVVFVKNELAPFVSIVKSASVATGIGNVVGNKGAVAVGLMLGSAKSFLFISSHFTAHQSKIAERNNDFHRIRNDLPIETLRSRRKGLHLAPDLPSRDVTDGYDYVFWFGDLNYRVNGTRKMIDSLISQKMHEVLLANDQLGIEMRKEAVFSGYQEAAITFSPTYKFNVVKFSARERDSDGDTLPRRKSTRIPSIRRKRKSSTSSAESEQSQDSDRERSNVDALPRDLDAIVEQADEVLSLSRAKSVIKPVGGYDSSNKQRIPSWTDRILFKSRKSHLTIVDELIKKHTNIKVNSVPSVSVLEYKSVPEMECSDHKPVIGKFSIDTDWSELLPRSALPMESKSSSIHNLANSIVVKTSNVNRCSIS